MKRKAAKRAHRHVSTRPRRSAEHYLVFVRSWMFVVAFALMLGVGAVMGTFISQQLNAGDVAGVTITR